MNLRVTILITDGDPIWLGSMTRLLEAEGYRVLPARTGVDALYQARMRRPDLILLNPDLSQSRPFRPSGCSDTPPRVSSRNSFTGTLWPHKHRDRRWIAEISLACHRTVTQIHDALSREE